MKAKQIPITTGPACGTMVTRVESNSGKLLGFIRVVAVQFPGSCCYPNLYIAQQCNRSYKHKLCDTLADAYRYLGISVEELDHSDLGKYPYEEKIPNGYWKNEAEIAEAAVKLYRINRVINN